jgi:thioredoxin-related protein
MDWSLHPVEISCPDRSKLPGRFHGVDLQQLFTETGRLNYAPCMRRILLLLVLQFLMCIAAYAAQQHPSAEQVLATAKSVAVEQHKDIFLVFGASWCPPCREMEAFLEDREIRPILEKYFVIATLNVQEERGKHPELNSPGGEKLVADFGGESAGVPFIVFLDEQGQLLINSKRPSKGKPNGENVGYPALPVEIDWFMMMLQKTLPSLTKADARTIETWLRRASAR